ncbi:two-component sensor histidine kinase [Gordonia sp. TBRC 11910]|uniref:Sensor-like histidine kinase SenX3 n=1 Tax=Gordonia asplenii TaxID=2725283 RepID=A0A848KZP2_9ACTN|nr:ATP-binding protein [Gordonia asplenii]NMO03879.1 two-component sensor histidine kinase [Gordonia asplenii]
MTVAWVIAAIAPALLFGVLIGWMLFGRSRGVSEVGVDTVSVATSPESEAGSESPTSVRQSADTIVTETADGRMTRAAMLNLIVAESETAVAVVDEFRDVVLHNDRAGDLGLVTDHLLADAVWEYAEQVVRTGEDARFEFTPPLLSGGFVATGRAPGRPVEAVRCLIRLVEQNTERYAVVYGADDSENLRVEATRRDFVANVSHELKTPVGAIGLLTEALLESADDPETVVHFGRRVGAEATRLGNMVTELIALSRLQGGETSAFESVDVDTLVSDALASAQISAEAVGITLSTDGPSELSVIGDRMLLLTALNNLIANAIAYSSPNTTVSVSRRVTSTNDRPMVAIAVTDRGIGIAPADQQRVFERFFRVDKARSRVTGGTGLGLAIVKHVAANHNGSIALWSKPGTGSTFTLSVPQDLAGTTGGPDPSGAEVGVERRYVSGSSHAQTKELTR